jgi:replication-associated recombination protein RarA
MRLFEKYRPKSLEEVVGQPKGVGQVRSLLERGGAGGKAFWISGPSGSGKTTLARIIAATIADPFFTREYAAADELTTAELDECDRTSRLTAWGKGGRAFIVNEAHGLRAGIQRRLDGLLEPVPAGCVWVFTTTWDGEDALFDGIDATPMLSRCFPIRLTNQGLARAFAEKALTIARAEGLDGQPLEAYVKLANRNKSNFRAMLQEIEAGCMIGGGAC